jgi:hypothetical protein
MFPKVTRQNLCYILHEMTVLIATICKWCITHMLCQYIIARLQVQVVSHSKGRRPHSCVRQPAHGGRGRGAGGEGAVCWCHRMISMVNMPTTRIAISTRRLVRALLPLLGPDSMSNGVSDTSLPPIWCFRSCRYLQGSAAKI